MPIHTFIDAKTGETTQVEMIGAELAEYEANTAEALLRLLATQAQEKQKAAVLAKLGLTADEAALLLGAN